MRAASAEAERLGHLVENVLAYSRLERRSQGARLETAEIGDLLAGMAGRLRARAERDGFQVTLPERAEGTVEADPAAVERILLNWVDNGCKYAAGAADRRLEIEVLPRGRFWRSACATTGRASRAPSAGASSAPSTSRPPAPPRALPGWASASP
jgi:signal transduction histidine kinase